MRSETSALGVQITESLQKAKKDELKRILKNLRLYKELVKKVWKRWKKIYHNKFDWINEYLVEYYWDLDNAYVLEKAKEVYKKTFGIDVKDDDIKIEQKETVKWGIKIYLNDNLLDLSFLRFYNLLKK